MIEPLHGPPVDQWAFEVVERKGLGHPDSICDALAEDFSRRLCRFYLDRFGAIAHHNVDKALLWGGAAHPAFGGGEVLEPMEIFLSGRATCEFKGVTVPIGEIAATCVEDWFRNNMPAVDPQRHVRVHCLVRPGSSDLVELFARQLETGVPMANDTSCGVGFAPASELERVVYRVERQLNSKAIKRNHPEIGEDIKVMGVRRGNHTSLTVAIALVGRFVTDIGDYREKKEGLAELVAEIARGETPEAVSVALNAGDDVDAGNIYLTVTGTSAESGDDGEVGRGNRANGLITPFRPMTMEAVAGKNPVSHVGKLYNLAAQRISREIVAEIDPVTDAQCCLVSQIGCPVTDPEIANVQIRTVAGVDVGEVAQWVEAIVRDELSQAGSLWKELIDGESCIC
jgi:S-adenosylmethionine synthetase